MSNLKLKLLIEAKLVTEEEYIYAKVIQQSNVDEHLFLLGLQIFPQKRWQFSIHFVSLGEIRTSILK
ncbi:hypothetical protein [Nostoc sp.]|uniref:hypothetical protein n=1 Tax=Nostoc sp. TaxID=1180 RepID=UPI002A67E476|nr:hypothetical protein [Nostoc sp. S13]